jgi:hypothetical protein
MQSYIPHLQGQVRKFANDAVKAIAASHLSDLSEAARAAAVLQLSPNRVRSLIGARLLAAYRPGGVGHWRITSRALADFRRAGAPAPPPQPEAPAARVDHGRWRPARRADTQEE